MYSKDILTVVLEKFHEIPFTNKKVACLPASAYYVVIFNQSFYVVKLRFYQLWHLFIALLNQQMQNAQKSV